MSRVIRNAQRRQAAWLCVALAHALPVGAMLVAANLASCTREEPAKEVRAVALVTTAARLSLYSVSPP